MAKASYTSVNVFRVSYRINGKQGEVKLTTLVLARDKSEIKEALKDTECPDGCLERELVECEILPHHVIVCESARYLLSLIGDE